MSKSSETTNIKSQFPPRKKSCPPSSANLQSQTVNLKECILNYQKDIQLLKVRIQELENHLEKLTEPDSNLIQLYNLAQIEWDKLSSENSKLKAFISKDSTQNTAETNSENQRLKAELERKNAIIREMANQPFFSSSLSSDENQLKKLTIENMRLKNELENANLALSLSNNVMSLDSFTKILAESQKTKIEPSEELKLLREENKSLRNQVSELESEVYEVSNNNPELQASLEAERQLRKLNRELEQKVHKLEIQLKSTNKPQNQQKSNENDDQSFTKNTNPPNLNKFGFLKPNKDDFDDFDDLDEFEKEIESMDDGFKPLKNTSDEDDYDDDNDNEKIQRTKETQKNKEFELTGEMAMFSAILGPLKKKLDERVRQVEMEKMKKEGVFAPINNIDEKDAKNDDDGLGVDIIDDVKNSDKTKDEEEDNKPNDK